jgi:hypothetical protein
VQPLSPPSPPPTSLLLLLLLRRRRRRLLRLLRLLRRRLLLLLLPELLFPLSLPHAASLPSGNWRTTSICMPLTGNYITLMPMQIRTTIAFEIMMIPCCSHC